MNTKHRLELRKFKQNIENDYKFNDEHNTDQLD